MSDDELMDSAIADFEHHFGKVTPTYCRMDFLNGEPVVVVENNSKRAFYSQRIELIKVINLKGEE